MKTFSEFHQQQHADAVLRNLAEKLGEAGFGAAEAVSYFVEELMLATDDEATKKQLALIEQSLIQEFDAGAAGTSFGAGLGRFAQGVGNFVRGVGQGAANAYNNRPPQQQARPNPQRTAQQMRQTPADPNSTAAALRALTAQMNRVQDPNLRRQLGMMIDRTTRLFTAHEKAEQARRDAAAAAQQASSMQQSAWV
jgi:hypothetical protein